MGISAKNAIDLVHLWLRLILNKYKKKNNTKQNYLEAVFRMHHQ